MEKEQLKELKNLIELAFKQTDKDLFYRIFKNFLEKSKRYGLDKENDFKNELKNLRNAKESREIYIILSRLLGLLNNKLRQVENKIIIQEYYPNNLTANIITLEKMQKFIKISKVKDKIKYLLENIENPEFLRRYSIGFPNNKLIDMFSLKLIVGHGITLRILYFMSDRKFRLCNIFINHDEYEKNINHGGYLKLNYQKETWLPVPRF